MPPSWSIANNSGIFPLLALFSIAAFCISWVRARVCLVSFTFSANKMTPPKSYLSIASATSALTLVRSCGDSWPASSHLRKSGMIICVTFCLRGMSSSSFSTWGDAVSVVVSVGEAAGTASRSVTVDGSATPSWFSVVVSGVGEATTSSTVAAGSLAWSDAWAVSAFAVWTDNRAKAANRAADGYMIFFIKRPPFFR